MTIKPIKTDSINLQKTLMFISMQKINFITHFFLEILHTYFEYFRHDKSHPSNYQILMVSTCRKLYLHQKSTSSLIYFKEYCKDLAKLDILGTLAMTGPTNLNWLHQIAESVMLICLQKSTSSLPSFLRYCKDFAKCYSKYFGHACMCPPKMISACRKTYVYLMLGMKFIPHLFLHMLLRYCKFGILGTLSMYRILTDQRLSMKYK